jgi:hypothetical protein
MHFGYGRCAANIANGGNFQDHFCPKNSKLKKTHKRQLLEQKCLVTYGRLNGFKSLSGTDPPNRAASVAIFTSTQRTISPK